MTLSLSFCPHQQCVASLELIFLKRQVVVYFIDVVHDIFIMALNSWPGEVSHKKYISLIFGLFRSLVISIDLFIKEDDLIAERAS